MNRKCPQCGSVDTGPSFTFDYQRDDSGRVIVRNPFFACGGCEHTGQVEMGLTGSQPFDPNDDESVDGVVKAINAQVPYAD